MSEQAEEEEMLLDVENTARDSRIYGSTVTGVASKDLRSHALTRVV